MVCLVALLLLLPQLLSGMVNLFGYFLTLLQLAR